MVHFVVLGSAILYYKTSSCTEATVEGVLLKEVFLKTLPNSQENACARVSFFNQVVDCWSLLLTTCKPEAFYLWIL